MSPAAFPAGLDRKPAKLEGTGTLHWVCAVKRAARIGRQPRFRASRTPEKWQWIAAIQKMRGRLFQEAGFCRSEAWFSAWSSRCQASRCKEAALFSKLQASLSPADRHRPFPPVAGHGFLRLQDCNEAVRNYEQAWPVLPPYVPDCLGPGPGSPARTVALRTPSKQSWHSAVPFLGSVPGFQIP
ncbi:hypothetical protein DSECCO2_388990 [anaerobic digester metagenome]